MGFLTKKKNSKEIVKDEASTFASVPRSVARRRHRRSVLPRRVYRVDEKVGLGPLDLPIFGPYTYISMSSRFIISYRLYLSLNLISEGRKEGGVIVHRSRRQDGRRCAETFLELCFYLPERDVYRRLYLSVSHIYIQTQ